MKRANNAEVPTREPRRGNRILRRHALAAGAGGASGGPVRCEPASPKAGEVPLPKAGPPSPPPRRGRGTRQYDDIDVEFYLDSMGGE